MQEPDPETIRRAQAGDLGAFDPQRLAVEFEKLMRIVRPPRRQYKPTPLVVLPPKKIPPSFRTVSKRGPDESMRCAELSSPTSSHLALGLLKSFIFRMICRSLRVARHRKAGAVSRGIPELPLPKTWLIEMLRTRGTRRP